MRGRFRHYHKNARTWGVIRLVLVQLGLLAAMVLALVRNPDERPLWALLLLTAAVAWAIPCLARRWLVDHLDVTNHLLKFVGYALVGAGLLSGVIRENVDETALVFTIFPVANAYCSLSWWVLSDSSIYVKN